MPSTKPPGQVVAPDLAREIAHEQAHVDLVYAELSRASHRAQAVATEGMSRGRTDRTGDVRDEEMSGLFERDVLVFTAARRQASLDSQYEGLVFGRLDMDGPSAGEREVRYIGRLGVRDDEYEPLVIDWRAPAASPFYRATPVSPFGVIRRRVLRSRDTQVIGVEDDLMVPEAPPDMTIVGDGALLAALTRSRGHQMRDIVATIQTHQDQAIRAPDSGVTSITGGPGTGKTVVALHRAAYLLYANRRRYESGGILVIGPNSAYTAYIERVLPSLGEESVNLRAVGDIVDAVTAGRVDTPEVAWLKGDTRIRQVLQRLAGSAVPQAPTALRGFVAGMAVHLSATDLSKARERALKASSRNAATAPVRRILAEMSWSQVQPQWSTIKGPVTASDRTRFFEEFADSLAVDTFLAHWWPQVDPRQALLWLCDTDFAYQICAGVLSDGDAAALADSLRQARDTGCWSIADAALIDELHSLLGEVALPEEEEFASIELLEGVKDLGVGGAGERQGAAPNPTLTPGEGRERLLQGHLGGVASYAHVLVDEAQDLSPMQWRMIGRRGRRASWTVVGDAAQASWPDAEAARQAQDEAWSTLARRTFHMDTNYRNAREIFAHAREVILPLVPDADIPKAVRETGVEPRTLSYRDTAALPAAARAAVEELAEQVDGLVAIIAPTRHLSRLAPLDGAVQGRVVLVDPLSCKGLEWDATLVVDPDAITQESPGGGRVLYVVLTRAAHRMWVLSPT